MFIIITYYQVYCLSLYLIGLYHINLNNLISILILGLISAK